MIFASKRTFHLDESLTYSLSNYFTGDWSGYFVYEPHGWFEKKFFNIYSVNDMPFRFDLVLKNQMMDDTPPLYYDAIHLMCSLIPGRFTIWTGFVINFLCLIVNCSIIAWIIYRFTKNSIVASITILVYSLNSKTIYIFQLIRMYMFLTMFVLLFLFFAIRLVDNIGNKYINYFGLFLDVLLGGFTHYYFFIHTGFIAICIGAYLLIKKRYCTLFVSIGLYLMSFLLNIFVLFPRFVGHVERENNGSIFEKLINIEHFVSTLDSHISFTWANIISFVLGLIIIVMCVLKMKKEKSYICILVLLISYYLNFFCLQQIEIQPALRYFQPTEPLSIIAISLFVYAQIYKKEVAYLFLLGLFVLNVDIPYIKEIKTQSSWNYAEKHQYDVALVINSNEEKPLKYLEINRGLFTDLRWYIATAIVDINEEFDFGYTGNAVVYIDKTLNQEDAIRYFERISNGEFDLNLTDIISTDYHVYQAINTK